MDKPDADASLCVTSRLSETAGCIGAVVDYAVDLLLFDLLFARGRRLSQVQRPTFELLRLKGREIETEIPLLIKVDIVNQKRETKQIKRLNGIIHT